MTVGTVIVDIPEGTTLVEAIRTVREAMESTPEGRVLSVIYDLPKLWAVTFPYEATITRAVLGPPSQRCLEDPWLFSGTLAIRVCDVQPERRLIIGEIAVLMFRRCGPMAYVRRGEVEPNILESSTITVDHPVFTRDVANNVWHLPKRGYKRELRERLAMLHSWADERTLVVRPNSRTSYAYRAADMDHSLIGVPRKSLYEWANPWTPLFTL